MMRTRGLAGPRFSRYVGFRRLVKSIGSAFSPGGALFDQFLKAISGFTDGENCNGLGTYSVRFNKLVTFTDHSGISFVNVTQLIASIPTTSIELSPTKIISYTDVSWTNQPLLTDLIEWRYDGSGNYLDYSSVIEAVFNGDFSTNTTAGWTLTTDGTITYDASSGFMSTARNGGGIPTFTQQLTGLTIGKEYRISWDILAGGVSDYAILMDTNTIVSESAATPLSKTILYTALSETVLLTVRSILSLGSVLNIDNISIVDPIPLAAQNLVMTVCTDSIIDPLTLDAIIDPTTSDVIIDPTAKA